MYQVQKTVEELNAIYQVGTEVLVLTVGELGVDHRILGPPLIGDGISDVHCCGTLPPLHPQW